MAGIVLVLTATIVDIKELGVRGGTYTRGKVLTNTGLIGKLEAGDVVHGGLDLVDNLGTSKHTCSEHVGHKPIMEKERNGPIPHGAGNGMISEHSEVHKGIDDGPERPGGMANVKHSALASNSDDLPDRIEGRSGKG